MDTTEECLPSILIFLMSCMYRHKVCPKEEFLMALLFLRVLKIEIQKRNQRINQYIRAGAVYSDFLA